jgi:hypothetical protein
LLVRKVLGPHLLGTACGLPLPAGVLEIPDQFPLLRVHRHDRLAPALEGAQPGVDVFELGVAVGMRRPFPGLAVGLQAVVQLMEQGSDRLVTDRMPLAAQFRGQCARTLAGPAEGGLGVAAGGRFDQSFQVPDQGGVGSFQEGAAGPGPADPFGVDLLLGLVGPALQLLDTRPDGGAGQAGRRGYRGSATPAQRLRFGRRPLPAQALGHRGAQEFKLRPHGFHQGYVSPNMTIAASSMPRIRTLFK